MVDEVPDPHVLSHVTMIECFLPLFDDVLYLSVTHGLSGAHTIIVLSGRNSSYMSCRIYKLCDMNVVESKIYFLTECCLYENLHCLSNYLITDHCGGCCKTWLHQCTWELC